MFFNFLINNLFNFPIFSFLVGIIFSLLRSNCFFNPRINSIITLFLLFSIGLKGGGALIEQTGCKVYFTIGLLVMWGLIQPFFSYLLLKKFTPVDSATAAAISACFGSISVMTYIAGANFLEKLDVSFDGMVVAALAIMEVPAIISGLLISKCFNDSGSNFKKLLKEAIFNKSVLLIFFGMVGGALCSLLKIETVPLKILVVFKPLLCLFLFNLGNLVGNHRKQLRQFSLSLSLFGLYMPILGAAFGILLSYLLQLDPGTGTLIAVLTASASYIAAPAAMRIALPEAKEAIYLPLSLGITFPFNVVIGIPVYYHVAMKLLTRT